MKASTEESPRVQSAYARLLRLLRRTSRAARVLASHVASEPPGYRWRPTAQELRRLARRLRNIETEISSVCPSNALLKHLLLECADTPMAALINNEDVRDQMIAAVVGATDCRTAQQRRACR